MMTVVTTGAGRPLSGTGEIMRWDYDDQLVANPPGLLAAAKVWNDAMADVIGADVSKC